MVFGMKKERNCVQIPFLLNVKYHGFWYEKENELCLNTLFYKISETFKEEIYILGKLDCGIKAVDLSKKNKLSQSNLSTQKKQSGTEIDGGC